MVGRKRLFKALRANLEHLRYTAMLFDPAVEYFQKCRPTCAVSRFRSKHSRMARRCSLDPDLS